MSARVEIATLIMCFDQFQIIEIKFLTDTRFQTSSVPVISVPSKLFHAYLFDEIHRDYNSKFEFRN